MRRGENKQDGGLLVSEEGEDFSAGGRDTLSGKMMVKRYLEAEKTAAVRD